MSWFPPYHRTIHQTLYGKWRDNGIIQHTLAVVLIRKGYVLQSIFESPDEPGVSSPSTLYQWTAHVYDYGLYSYLPHLHPGSLPTVTLISYFIFIIANDLSKNHDRKKARNQFDCGPAFVPPGRPGWASLRGAPTPLGSKNQRKIRETGSSKYSFLRRLDQTFDCSAVGACRRAALPWPARYPASSTFYSALFHPLTHLG